MASCEVIGLLSAGSVAYHDPVRSTTRSSLSRAEIAGLLAGLSPMAMNLALAKYAGDIQSERNLIAQVRCWTVAIAIDEHWQVVKGRPTICNLSALAVFEVVRPNRCVRCGGSGILINKPCIRCGGDGYRSLSGRQIATGMGIDEAIYRRLWKLRFQRVYSHVNALDCDVRHYVSMADRSGVIAA